MSNTLTPIFNLGAQISASVLGSTYRQYRPATANNPTSSSNLIATIPAWITADANSNGKRAFSYAKPVGYGLFDPTVTQVGDYLIGPLGTFFIGSQDVPMPMQVIRCNHTVNITQPPPLSTYGKQSGYGADIKADETQIGLAWPCSILQGTKGEMGTTKLPGDTKMPWFAILLPAIPSVVLRNNMIFTDEEGFRHVASSVELSALGYRITATLATT